MIKILEEYNKNCVYDNARQKIAHRDMVDFAREGTIKHYMLEYIEYLLEKNNG